MDDFEPIDHEKDWSCQLAYSEKKGREKGREEERLRMKEDLIRNLLTMDFSEMQMASITQLTIADFRTIRAKLGI